MKHPALQVGKYRVGSKGRKLVTARVARGEAWEKRGSEFQSLTRIRGRVSGGLTKAFQRGTDTPQVIDGD